MKPVLYPGSSAQQQCQCSSRINAGTDRTDVGRGSLEQPTIECLRTIGPEDSGAEF